MSAFELLTTTVSIVGVGMLIPVILLSVEVIAAFKTRPTFKSRPSTAPRIAVIVPAHNEATVLRATLDKILPELAQNDRLLVVADNCTDQTAEIAKSAGAEVISRVDTDRRGKGFALEFGMCHLAGNPPDVVIFIDADCTPEPGGLRILAATAAQSQRPIQAQNSIVRPGNARTPYLLMAEFASRVKNLARPLGCLSLGLPCQLMGTGMAFPWKLISTHSLATADIVEDLVYGLEFARSGHPPLFCPEAKVTSAFPLEGEGQETQRTRWETGHLNIIGGVIPRHILNAVRHGNWMLLFLALDAAVPPLALLALAIASYLFVTLLLALLGGAQIAFVIALGCGLIFLMSVLLAWWRVGRDILSLRELALVPWYIFVKLALYWRILTGRKVDWIRSRRDIQ